MKLFLDLWNDESGLVMSAEAVTVGTVGVLGAVVGMNAANNAVNDELKEMANAIRSFDQSYGYVGHKGCGAWTAGSYYIQPPVQLAEINGSDQTDIKSIQKQVDDERKVRQPPVQNFAPQEPVPAAIPNQIPNPVPEKKDDKAAANP